MALTPAALRRARLDVAPPRRGKPCGSGFISADFQCRLKTPVGGAAVNVNATPRGGVQVKTKALTPKSLRSQSEAQQRWQRKAAMVAGGVALGAAVALPTAGWFMSGTPQGRRAARGIEALTTGAAAGIRSWSSGPMGVVGMPLAAGMRAGAQGMGVARSARRALEVRRAAPTWAAEAGRLAQQKLARAADLQRQLEQLQAIWAAKGPTTPVQQRQRQAQLTRLQRQIDALLRQAQVRSRAAVRGQQLSQPGNAVQELGYRAARLAYPPRTGLQRRRVRFYGSPRRDAQAGGEGKRCGESFIPRSHECRKGQASPPAGPAVSRAQVLGAAALAGGVVAATYAWSKRDAADLREAMDRRPIADGTKHKPGLIEQLLAERRAGRCGKRSDALPLSAVNSCAESTFAEIYLSKDGQSVFKVPKERDLRAHRREFQLHAAAYEAGVPTPKPLAYQPRTGVIRMERVPGRTGEEIFGENFDASLHPRYGLQLSSAMRTMHRLGIAHGDLHIGNWMETPSGAIKVIDWGQGSRKKHDLIFDLQDQNLSFCLGFSQGPDGFIRRHPALDGFDELVNRTVDSLDSINPGTVRWRKVIDEHYDALDRMFRNSLATM